MPAITTRLSRPIALTAALTMVLAFALPVAAAPAGSTGTSAAVQATHVDPADCDVITDVGGVLTVSGTALTDEQVTSIGADAEAALRLAAVADADADAGVCADVVIDPEDPTSITVNADIRFCGEVAADGEARTVGGIAVPAVFLDAGLRNALALAAAADVDACLTVTVTDNAVIVDANAVLCVSATQTSDTNVTLSIGDQDFVLTGTIVDADGELETDTEVEVGLQILATLTAATDTSVTTITVVDITGCGDVAGGAALSDTATATSGSHLALIALGVLLFGGAASVAAAKATARRR